MNTKAKGAGTAPDVLKANVGLRFEDERKFCRIGLIALATDLTSEYDFRCMMSDPAVRVHVTRIFYANPVTPENLGALADGLASSAELLAPDTPLKAVYFSCTAASALLGQETVEAKIHTVRPNVTVITPLSAAVRGFEALGVRRISVLTPYTEAVARLVGDYFLTRGFGIDRLCCLGLEDDRMMARLAPATIVEAARHTAAPESDALFISCTALPAVQTVAAVEREIARPVVTSNQAAAWFALRSAGRRLADSRFGTLMTVTEEIR